MKVAFVVPSITAGGAERVVVRLANYLADRGLKVFIFVTRAPDIGYDILPKVKMVQLPALDAPHLLKAIAEHHIDIVSSHYHWSYAHIKELALVAAAGVKIILSEHNSYFYPLFQAAAEQYQQGLDIYYNRSTIYRSFTAVTALTRYSANLLASEGLNNIVLMYNPVSYETDELSDLSQPRLLNVSSFLKPAKRIDYLFQAFGLIAKSYPGARLRIVGEFDYDRYIRYCRESDILPSSAEIVGISHNVSEHYLASSIFAMSSEIEGQPMALLEAASHGVPQMVYDIPGIEDQILHGETGYIVEPGDHAQFAAYAVELLRDKNLRLTMGRRAREFVGERFNFERIGERWHLLLEEVHSAGHPSEATRWSLGSTQAQSVRSDVLPEINRWMRKLANPAVAPLVSIIIPVYDTEDLLGRCLESLIAQTMKEIEIIVVNDASPGNTLEVVEYYQRKDSRIVYAEHQANRGLYQARSTGARIARGTYLAHVDSDDFVHVEFIRRLYDAAVFDGADIVECAAVEVSTNGERWPFNKIFEKTLVQPALLEAFLDEKIRHVVWNKLYRKTVWDAAPLHMQEMREFSITEDLLRNATIFATAKKYRFVDIVLYYYVRREQSVVTGGNFSRMLAKLNDVGYVYSTVTDLFRAAGVEEVKLDRIRQRQITDYIWYLENGYKPGMGTPEEMVQKSLDFGGIFCAVAVQQSIQLANLRKMERSYWEGTHKFNALTARIAELEAALRAKADA